MNYRLEYSDMTNADRKLTIIANRHENHVENPLLALKYVQVCALDNTKRTFRPLQTSSQNPLFASDYHMTEQQVNASFNGVHVNLHREALIDLQKFANDLQMRIAAVCFVFGCATTFVL